MGQQQVLFVILAVCIIAIAVSVGVLSLSGHAVVDNRTLLSHDLELIARKAQGYYQLSSEQGGGDGSFNLLSRMPDALSRLGFLASNAHGDFFVKKSTNSSSIQVVAVGIESGYDRKRPLRMMITIWPDRTALSILN